MKIRNIVTALLTTCAMHAVAQTLPYRDTNLTFPTTKLQHPFDPTKLEIKF